MSARLATTVLIAFLWPAAPAQAVFARPGSVEAMNRLDLPETDDRFPGAGVVQRQV